MALFSSDDHTARNSAVNTQRDREAARMQEMFDRQQVMLKKYVESLLQDLAASYRAGHRGFRLLTDGEALERTYPGISHGKDIGKELLRFLNKSLQEDGIEVVEDYWQREPGFMTVKFPEDTPITPPPSPEPPTPPAQETIKVKKGWRRFF